MRASMCDFCSKLYLMCVCKCLFVLLLMKYKVFLRFWYFCFSWFEMKWASAIEHRHHSNQFFGIISKTKIFETTYTHTIATTQNKHINLILNVWAMDICFTFYFISLFYFLLGFSQFSYFPNLYMVQLPMS